MTRLVEIFLVLIYNLALLAGSAYLIIEHDWSSWILLLALILAASWDKQKPTVVEIGK